MKEKKYVLQKGVQNLALHLNKFSLQVTDFN